MRIEEEDQESAKKKERKTNRKQNTGNQTSMNQGDECNETKM